MVFRPSRPVLAAALIAFALPAIAQQRSESTTFLNAVREQDGNKVTEMLNEPGQSVVNAKDGKGEGAIHIVVKRRDRTYLNFILARGGDANLQDRAGNTPLMLAVEAAYPEGVTILLSRGANINLANNGGETPLIRAVQRRDIELVRMLLTNKADPDQSDRLAGMSARDYAAADARSPMIAQMLKNAPKAEKRAVSGPSF
ncbi:ankyrin repeat domain-containing protein [Sphingomonas sp. LT1P40]|uniref:ankyrin repeat domain-containing protein n=1 Tax=Alteristakelama amylovorans TaxID=3096166 RepID=UPI002FC60820